MQKCLRRQRSVQKYCLIQISFYREQKSEEEILSQTASQLIKLLNRSLIVYPEQNGDLGSEQVFGIDGEVPRNIFSAPEERDAANWTFANKKAFRRRHG